MYMPCPYMCHIKCMLGKIFSKIMNINLFVRLQCVSNTLHYRKRPIYNYMGLGVTLRLGEGKKAKSKELSTLYKAGDLC